jgi:ring-1,2-phenylacetyl-CoA epoxidase subunit PaaD
MVTAEEIWQGLAAVKDPEIPVVSVVEMGIVRDVSVAEDGRVVVKMTPTFSGCPALHVMRADIEKKVMAMGATAVTVETVLSPAWTTDWISDEARQKLKAFGLTPPTKHGGNLEITFYDLAACPYCDSNNTSIKNTFGPTLCRAIYYCNDCRQPFEQFKAL